MTWPTLKSVRTATKLEFVPELARKHVFVYLPSGSWTRVLGAPPREARPVGRGRRVWYIPETSFNVQPVGELDVRPTHYRELGYTNLGPGLWRFVDLSDGSVVGSIFRTKQKLLAALDDYAREFGATLVG